MPTVNHWNKYKNSLIRYPELGFSLDTSRMGMTPSLVKKLEPEIQTAFKGIKAIESGKIANPDEKRMVGHYWLRDPEIAPTKELKKKIVEPLGELKSFAKKVLSGQITNPNGARFENLLIIGIGGSALGPQFIYDSLGTDESLNTYFLDNTDPEGMDRVLAKVVTSFGGLAKTLTIIISKSGGTAETRNGMLEVKAIYEEKSLDFGRYAIAVTGEGSLLYKFAKKEKFRAIFPMEDWVGGRTSVMSTVGLVPAALQRIDVDSLLDGAAQMDEKTRTQEVKNNAAVQLALAWHHAGKGKGLKDMVILPYKDSLLLFSRYLQQLVMESLGKEKDLKGDIVNQGIAVYGNKGSTDQHAYVQQLRDGIDNFFVTFIEVLKSRDGDSIEVTPGVTSGDYLQGFLRGSREALTENKRLSLTITIEEVNAQSIGALIALYERAVSFYALLINVNAYHQPGVEAGKKAADLFLKLLIKVKKALGEKAQTAEVLAEKLKADPEEVYHCLNHLSANGQAMVRRAKTPANDKFTSA